jgi:prepilin-type N-terminal cleavage/methylation domain-containing protein
MECKNISTEPARRASRAFTLVEMLVALGITSVVMVVLAQLTYFTGRSFAGLMNYTELDKYSRNALDQMIFKIRQSDHLKSFTTNRMVFSYNTTNDLVYEYFPDSKLLIETLAGRRKTLLKECDELRFSIFQRNTVAGSYDQFPATMTNSTAKLVQLNWTCSRRILGARVNTESVQSAKIVIRNQ